MCIITFFLQKVCSHSCKVLQSQTEIGMDVKLEVLEQVAGVCVLGARDIPGSQCT